METKICSECGIEKALNEFYTRKRKKGIVYRNECKECTKKKVKQLKDLKYPKKIIKETGIIAHCNKCQADKDETEYNPKDKRTAVLGWCKECFKEYDKKYKEGYREVYPDKIC